MAAPVLKKVYPVTEDYIKSTTASEKTMLAKSWKDFSKGLVYKSRDYSRETVQASVKAFQTLEESLLSLKDVLTKLDTSQKTLEKTTTQKSKTVDATIATLDQRISMLSSTLSLQDTRQERHEESISALKTKTIELKTALDKEKELREIDSKKIKELEDAVKLLQEANKKLLETSSRHETSVKKCETSTEELMQKQSLVEREIRFIKDRASLVDQELEHLEECMTKKLTRLTETSDQNIETLDSIQMEMASLKTDLNKSRRQNRNSLI